MDRRLTTLRLSVLGAIGLGTGACSDRSLPGDSSTGAPGSSGSPPGGTTVGSTSGSDPDSSGGSQGVSSEGTDGTDTGAGSTSGSGPLRLDVGNNGIRFDVGPDSGGGSGGSDERLPEACPVPQWALDGAVDGTCVWDETLLGPREYVDEVCMPLPEGVADCLMCQNDTCNPLVNGTQVEGPCIRDEYSGGGGWGTDAEVLCGPFQTDTGECCYMVGYEHPGIIPPTGRPFEVNGNPRVATITERPGWRGNAAPRPITDPDLRHALATAWLRDALGEHASVAAFARFTLDLMSLGAPPELLSGAAEAMHDEIRHARHCFALASAYAQNDVSPGALDVGGAGDNRSLEAIVRDLVIQGCVAETVAGAMAGVAAEHCRDDGVRTILDGIARDEARHAALAWRTLAWLVRTRGPAVAHIIPQAFREGAASIRSAFARRHGDGPTSNASTWREHGRLPSEDCQRVLESTLAEVIEPAAKALLARIDGTDGHHASSPT